MPVVVKVQAVPDPVVAEQHQCLVVFGYMEVKLAETIFVIHTTHLMGAAPALAA